MPCCFGAYPALALRAMPLRVISLRAAIGARVTARVAFKKADLDRALECVERRGLTVARIDLNDNGASIVIGEPERRKRNPLDRLHAA